MPGEDGLWQKLAGEKSLASFGGELPKLAENITGFVSNLGTFDESKVTAVECAGNAIKALATAASEIPNEGGLWGAICGENSLATFGSNLPGLGTYLNGIYTNTGNDFFEVNYLFMFNREVAKEAIPIADKLFELRIKTSL